VSKVYRNKPLAPDELLGHLEPDGKVYESRFGPDKYIGRVDLDSGQIYEARLGPDKLVGHVALDSGKVYHPRLGPDEYLGGVDADGRCQRHIPLARDEYLGKVVEMESYAHGGAAFLLLVLPAWEEQETERKEIEQAARLGKQDKNLPEAQSDE
jgi:hypothetical protein